MSAMCKDWMWQARQWQRLRCDTGLWLRKCKYTGKHAMHLGAMAVVKAVAVAMMVVASGVLCSRSCVGSARTNNLKECFVRLQLSCYAPHAAQQPSASERKSSTGKPSETHRGIETASMHVATHTASQTNMPVRARPSNV
eukprot:3801071-Alexandrium_andersonii.AAC.1